ncbi:MAG: preprotein translocase subunit YajC [Planctomycetota bacterium]|nr:MAG: preprotein translocase subunit YajC [Planctomycetota bacterium]
MTEFLSLWLLAEAGASPNQDPSQFWISMALIGGPALFIIYFLMIRPQQREQAAKRAMWSSLKKNDRIMTVGGIIGTVTNVHQDAGEVTIRIDESNNTRMRIKLAAVAQVLAKAEGDSAGADTDAAKKDKKDK